MTVEQIIEAMTKEQRRTSRDSLGDALDIVSVIVGDMPYSRLFSITVTVIDRL